LTPPVFETNIVNNNIPRLKALKKMAEKKHIKEKIIKIEKGKEGIVLPEEYLRSLELIPGSEVELCLDKKRRWIILRALDSDEFIEHFRDSMESMA
jgi:hypothetical protein